MFSTFFSIVAEKINKPTELEAEIIINVDINEHPTIGDASAIYRIINLHLNHLRHVYPSNVNIRLYSDTKKSAGTHIMLNEDYFTERIILGVIQRLQQQYQKKVLASDINIIYTSLILKNWRDIMNDEQRMQFMTIINRLLPQIQDIEYDYNKSIRGDMKINIETSVKPAVIRTINTFKNNPIERFMFEQITLERIKYIYNKLTDNPTIYGGNMNTSSMFVYAFV
jgi:uncharacterized protein YsxB (DUF464 family)